MLAQRFFILHAEIRKHVFRTVATGIATDYLGLRSVGVVVAVTFQAVAIIPCVTITVRKVSPKIATGFGKTVCVEAVNLIVLAAAGVGLVEVLAVYADFSQAVVGERRHKAGIRIGEIGARIVERSILTLEAVVVAVVVAGRDAEAIERIDVPNHSHVGIGHAIAVVAIVVGVLILRSGSQKTLRLMHLMAVAVVVLQLGIGTDAEVASVFVLQTVVPREHTAHISIYVFTGWVGVVAPVAVLVHVLALADVVSGSIERQAATLCEGAGKGAAGPSLVGAAAGIEVKIPRGHVFFFDGEVEHRGLLNFHFSRELCIVRSPVVGFYVLHGGCRKVGQGRLGVAEEGFAIDEDARHCLALERKVTLGVGGKPRQLFHQCGERCTLGHVKGR